MFFFPFLMYNLNLAVIGGVFLLGLLTGAVGASWLGLRCQVQVTVPTRSLVKIEHAMARLKVAEVQVDRAMKRAEQAMLNETQTGSF